jgi:hypothetical protein
MSKSRFAGRQKSLSSMTDSNEKRLNDGRNGNGDGRNGNGGWRNGNANGRNGLGLGERRCLSESGQDTTCYHAALCRGGVQIIGLNFVLGFFRAATQTLTR